MTIEFTIEKKSDSAIIHVAGKIDATTSGELDKRL